MEIYKIVITGGPCAGKTTAMSWIQNAFTERGYSVIFIPETATELISGGVAPWTCGTNLDYQKGQMLLQKKKEEIFEMCINTMKVKKVLIVCDRGQLDNKVYMTEEDYKKACEFIGSNETELKESYDAVFHLVTSAKGAEKFYTTENNSARIETVDQARKIDDGLIDAWTGHPHYYIVDNSYNFEDKMKRLIYDISSYLGEAKPYITERKFLIKYPSKEVIDKIGKVKKVQIKQTYLLSDQNVQLRVRERIGNGRSTYYLKKKDEVKGVEREKRLSLMEYNEYLSRMDPSKNVINKTRYCFARKNQYFEIDLFSFWSDQAILEVKLASLDDEVLFPEGIEVIKEVTGVQEYRNSVLANKK